MSERKKKLASVLDKIKSGRLSPDEAEADLGRIFCPEHEVADAVIDTTRAGRTGFPEAVYAAGKTPAQVEAIVGAMKKSAGRALATRCPEPILERLKKKFPGGKADPVSRTFVIGNPPRKRGGGTVAVLAAGTSDLPVAEEAAVTLEFAGIKPVRFYDIGVAGIHRLLGRIQEIRKADVTIVAAGMEGALPSVVGGLVDSPLIAVPTSVGYGASFHGVSALLAMLNSCAPGITVVNIDNGFGAAVAAVKMILRRTL